MRRLLPWLVSTIALASAVSGCGGPFTAAPERRAAPGAPRPPVPPPIVTVTGCVESRELSRYVLALDAQRAEARARALAASGASDEQRRGRWGEPGLAPLDQIVSQGGRRFGVVAELSSGFEPVASLARSGQELRRIDERARAHPVPVLSCSERRCPKAPPAPPARSDVRPLLVELAADESLGAPLTLAYDYWWAAVEYASSERCPAGD